MNTTDYAREVLSELERTLAAIAPQDAEALVELIEGAERIFLAGAGRSGLAVKAFAMRLMHMGLAAHVVGETATPGMGAADLLIIGSGSGETGSLVAMAGKAQRLGGRLALVTIFPQSSIGKLADVVVRIPAPTPKAEGGEGGLASIQPMGSLFEQSLLIFLDILVMRLMERQKIVSATMFERHANLE